MQELKVPESFEIAGTHWRTEMVDTPHQDVLVLASHGNKCLYVFRFAPQSLMVIAIATIVSELWQRAIEDVSPPSRRAVLDFRSN